MRFDPSLRERPATDQSPPVPIATVNLRIGRPCEVGSRRLFTAFSTLMAFRSGEQICSVCLHFLSFGLYRCFKNKVGFTALAALLPVKDIKRAVISSPSDHRDEPSEVDSFRS